MAKSSKVEDYWREHSIESLFKELTHILVQRMPSDPAVAIVQHLQKKFPKSFRTSTDNDSNIGVVSKTMATNLQLQSMTSPRSDVNIESASDVQMRRRSSNLSQVSGIAMIPTAGSAFTDLLKPDTNGSRQAPELSLRNLVFANRLGQQVFKMGKDIRSDRDILDEEVIKPIKTKPIANVSINSISDDLQSDQTHDELSVPQLIKYKQQIRTENDRRLHREKLAELAKHQREKEQSFQSDAATRPEEIEQEQNLDGDDKILPRVARATSNTKLSHQPIVQSKEEEEILDDENVFQPRRNRFRGRHRNRILTSDSNTPYIRRRFMPDFGSSMRKGDENGMLVCKVCGSEINGEEKRPIEYSQPGSAAQTARSFEREPSARSVETTGGAVDDWFESESDASGTRQLSPWAPDNPTPPPPTGSNTYRRDLFQPINDNTVEHRPPIRPLVLADNEIKTKRSTTPRMSESGIFARSPESKIRRSSSSRSVPSPVTKKQQTDTNHQLAKTISPSGPIPSSTLTTTTATMASNNNRKMSGWSVREHSPDDSDDN